MTRSPDDFSFSSSQAIMASQVRREEYEEKQKVEPIPTRRRSSGRSEAASKAEAAKRKETLEQVCSQTNTGLYVHMYSLVVLPMHLLHTLLHTLPTEQAGGTSRRDRATKG